MWFSAHNITRLKSAHHLSCILIWRFWEKLFSQIHSGHWQNLVPSVCRTEVPVSLLAVSLGLFSASRGKLHTLTCGPFLKLQIQQGWVESFSHLISFWPTLLPRPSLSSSVVSLSLASYISLFLRAQVIRIGQFRQSRLSLCHRAHNLRHNHSCKFAFAVTKLPQSW